LMALGDFTGESLQESHHEPLLDDSVYPLWLQ
jgi:hypothetical protein